jgi:dTDP-glucose 4,6-dehydratase
MRTILVTGGAGFIGGCFVRGWLRLTPHALVNLDKLTYAGNPQSLTEVENDPRYHFVLGDIGDRPLVDRLLSAFQPQAIINFAAESHVDRSIDGPRPFLRTNVLGTFELLEAALEYWRKQPADARDQFRFLHVSTDEVYGSLGPGGRFHERSPYAPNSPYSASKAASDHFVRAYHHTYGLPVLTTNCSNNYGPYQFPEKLLPLMILNTLDRRPLPVYGDGQQVRDWLHVEDHCAALRLVLDQGRVGEVYHVGGNCELTNLSVVRMICDLVDPQARDLIQFVEDRPGHDRRYAMDTDKIERELGWKPTMEFAAGLQSTVQWYRQNRPWVAAVESRRSQRDRQGLGNR